MIRLFTLLGLGAIAVTVSACNSSTAQSDETAIYEVVDVGPEKAAAVIAEEEVVVLDVRTPEEFAAGRISGAVNYNVKANGFEEAIKSLDFSKPIVVHCAAGLPGGRSRFALDFLKVAGAGKVYHLDGGMMAWEEAGQPIER